LSDNIKFLKGIEADLPKGSNIIVGALYHCVDTGNTYIGILDNGVKTLELYSNVSDITKAEADKVYATKEEVNNINFPVDTVNGKTGTITLTAADVGAAASSHN
jgi:hypothetical protein